LKEAHDGAAEEPRRAWRLAADEQDALADRVADLETAQGRFLTTGTPTSSKRTRLVALAAAVVAVLTVVAVSVSRFERAKAALTFRVGEAGPFGEPDAWIAPPTTALLPLGFSDGTSVTLEPSARARVTKLSAVGATILLESGERAFRSSSERAQPGRSRSGRSASM